MKIAVSACLLGTNCKYNGGNNYNEKLAELLKGHEVTAVCPEVLGGLPIPRKPAEIVSGTVRRADNVSVDEEFRTGAERALQIVKEQHAELVILQPRSPSCGAKQIYDGTFSGKKIEGRGIFAEVLKKNGIAFLDLEDAVSSLQEKMVGGKKDKEEC